MKIVKVVEFGVTLSSSPESDDVADDAVRRLQTKGVEAYAVILSEEEVKLHQLMNMRPVDGNDPDFDYEKGVLKRAPSSK